MEEYTGKKGATAQLHMEDKRGRVEYHLVINDATMKKNKIRVGSFEKDGEALVAALEYCERNEITLEQDAPVLDAPAKRKRQSTRKVNPSKRQKISGLSACQQKAYNMKKHRPNEYYYRLLEDGEEKKNGAWDYSELRQFMKRLKSHGATEWGIFSKGTLKGRCGYTCSSYYRKLLDKGWIWDKNYVVNNDTGRTAMNRNAKFETPERRKQHIKYAFIVLRDPTRTFNTPGFSPQCDAEFKRKFQKDKNILQAVKDLAKETFDGLATKKYEPLKMPASAYAFGVLDNKSTPRRDRKKKTKRKKPRIPEKKDSNYIGVTWDQKRQTWKSVVHIDGKRFHLGQSRDEDHAASKVREKCAELEKSGIKLPRAFGTPKTPESNVDQEVQTPKLVLRLPRKKASDGGPPPLEKDSGFKFVELRGNRWYGANGIEVGQFESERHCAYAVAAHFICKEKQVPDPCLLAFPTKAYEKTDPSWLNQWIGDRWDGENEWYNGKIIEILSETEFRVKYFDGDDEYRVLDVSEGSFYFIKDNPAISMHFTSGVLSDGKKIEKQVVRAMRPDIMTPVQISNKSFPTRPRSPEASGGSHIPPLQPDAPEGESAFSLESCQLTQESDTGEAPSLPFKAAFEAVPPPPQPKYDDSIQIVDEKKRKLNSKRKEIENWSGDQVIDWIRTLHIGERETFVQGFLHAGITGLDLAEIEWDDIDHDFGSGSRFETMRMSRKRFWRQVRRLVGIPKMKTKQEFPKPKKEECTIEHF